MCRIAARAIFLLPCNDGYMRRMEHRTRGLVDVDGLKDANFAGKNKKDCVLMISEGDSAKTYIVAGMKYGFGQFVGRDTIGVLPIRGKFLNVKGVLHKKTYV